MTDDTPHAPVPLNTPRGPRLIEWPGDNDAPVRPARARQWLYERTPQLIIVATAALMVLALVIVAVVEVAP